MGLFGAIGKALKSINPLDAIGGGLAGGLSALGANSAAKTAAKNQNAMNSWKYQLDRSQYGTERMPYYQQGSKMRGWRDALMRGVMRNPNNGLSKLFAGWDEGKGTAFNAGQDVRAVQDPYAVAGAPPQLKAETGGWKSVLGGTLGGALG
jgi:arylsulfatase A-like enzyme